MLWIRLFGAYPYRRTVRPGPSPGQALPGICASAERSTAQSLSCARPRLPPNRDSVWRGEGTGRARLLFPSDMPVPRIFSRGIDSDWLSAMIWCSGLSEAVNVEKLTQMTLSPPRSRVLPVPLVTSHVPNGSFDGQVFIPGRRFCPRARHPFAQNSYLPHDRLFSSAIAYRYRRSFVGVAISHTSVALAAII